MKGGRRKMDKRGNFSLSGEFSQMMVIVVMVCEGDRYIMI